jgi:hypothetical protein
MRIGHSRRRQEAADLQQERHFFGREPGVAAGQEPGVINCTSEKWQLLHNLDLELDIA